MMKSKPKNKNYKKYQNKGLLFVLPSIIFILLFFIIPFFMTVWMSFQDWPLFGEKAFTGIENYIRLVKDTQFWDSLWFTTKYTLLVTPVIFFLAFILAEIVNSKIRGIGFFRTVYFIPVVIGLGTSSLLWIWLLNDRVGIFNRILVDLNMISHPIVWLGEKNLALGAIIVSVVWKTTGFAMILLLAGLQAIPKEIYQAALVDGANYWKQLRFITLPLLRRTFALALVISVIGSYLGFDQFYIMTRGGPQNQTISAVYWIYANAFVQFKMGYASALSIILLVVLVVLSIIQLYLLRDDTTY